MAQCPHGRAAMQGRSCLPSPRSHSPAALQLESCECDVWQPPPAPPRLSHRRHSHLTRTWWPPPPGTGRAVLCACIARLRCLVLACACLHVLARAHLQMATAACAFPRACVLAHACVCACFLARLQVGSHVRPSVHTCVSAGGGGMAALCSCAHACACAVTPQGRGDTCPPPPPTQPGWGRTLMRLQTSLRAGRDGGALGGECGTRGRTEGFGNVGTRRCAPPAVLAVPPCCPHAVPRPRWPREVPQRVTVRVGSQLCPLPCCCSARPSCWT